MSKMPLRHSIFLVKYSAVKKKIGRHYLTQSREDRKKIGYNFYKLT